jgi:hypothetical protein
LVNLLKSMSKTDTEFYYDIINYDGLIIHSDQRYQLNHTVDISDIELSNNSDYVIRAWDVEGNISTFKLLLK